MDIHNVDSENFSVEDVVKAHMKDIAVQKKFGVVQIKYWVDTGNKKIFCLMKGPNKKACNAVHEESHGGTACNIIEVSDDEFNLFLGVGSKNENDLAQTLSGGVDAGFRTLLMICAYDFTGKYKHYTHQIHKLIQKYNGAIVLDPNDDIIASFISAKEAIACAKSISNLLKSIHDNYEFRLALATGNPVDELGTNLFEETKRKIKYLCKIGSNDIIYIHASTKSLSDKEQNPPKMDNKNFRIIKAVNFLFIEKLFSILKSELYKPSFKSENLYTSLGLSKSQAYRKIKSLTGIAPNKLIQELRLQQSLKEIKKNYKSIAEIAYDCGFNSPTYFTRVFRERFNILPTSFIKLSIK